MKKTKFQRITALILALVVLCCGGALSVSADNSSVSGTTTDDIKALLNAISYSDYILNQSEVPLATQDVVIDATTNFNYVTAGGEAPAENAEKNDVAHVDTFDGKTGLYVPAAGTVSWTTNAVTSAARYNVVIDYYPVEHKAASIERIFMINGEVPFAEARYMTMSKIWKNTYPDGQFTLAEGEDANAYLSKAAELGITAEKITADGVTSIKYKMPECWTEKTASLVDELALRFFTIDVDGNEIRSSLTQAPEWTEYIFKDSNGFYQTPFQFTIAPDENDEVTLSMQSVNEPVVIKSIRLVVPEDVISYKDYQSQYANAAEGTGKIKIEGEYFSATSTQTIYPVSDTTSAITSPSAVDRTLLNTVGGDKWQSSGQWIEYTFRVEKSGMYQITARFKQSLLDGMYTSRMLMLYSEGLNEGDAGYYNGLPFEEAGRLQFNFSSEWQSGALSDGTNEFSFYFQEGVEYRMRLEVSLGNMGDVVRRVQASLNAINNDYLNILKLTGADPDQYRDYGFTRIMPDTMADMIRQGKALTAISEELTAAAGEKSSMTATLDKVARLLDQMGRDEDEVAKNMEQLKTYIGSLGTWLSDAKTQPLTIDFFSIQPKAEELPEAKAGFWKTLWYEISGFWQSFFRNYDRMGAMTETTTEDTVEVWLAYGRDQSQVIRGLINNDFTPHYNIPINLKLVAAGTLLPSILSGQGPDVYIGLAQGDVINYAIRGALVEIEDMDGYRTTVNNFNEAAMVVLGIEDAEGAYHCYGLPETQNFSMMFVREDILADLDIEIPKTWDDVKEAIPVLQANNMQIGMQNDSNIFLYQSGGELFADGGMRINLDSNVALEAFTTMCDMYTMYSFPYKYDFPNRFRTGEMPIGFAPYTATYNHLKVFATEIEGLWGFYPLPGYADEQGNINNVAVSTVSAIVMITGCEQVKDAWEFMKWHVGAQCQVDYSNEMVAILGPSAKHPTANETALESMPWTAEEYEQLSYQFNNLASIPNYPGAYIIARYTQFAFLDAFNDSVEPAMAIQQYVTTINKEITRKRAEFGLETLDYIGQTLAQKRLAQAEQELKSAHDSSSYSSAYDTAYNNVMKLIAGYETEDYGSIRAMADELEQLNSKLFVEAVGYLRKAANALVSYEAYK